MRPNLYLRLSILYARSTVTKKEDEEEEEKNDNNEIALILFNEEDQTKSQILDHELFSCRSSLLLLKI